MRRLALAAVVVLALAALLAWLTRDGRERRTLETPSPLQGATPTAPPLRTPSEGRAAADATPDPPSVTRARDSAEASDAPVAPPRLLMGTIVALDATDREYRDESGLLVFALGTRDHREIEVRHGAFLAGSVELHGGETLRVLTCSLGERLALPESQTPVSIPADEYVELRVRWRAEPLLHVRARDGGELDEIVLFEPALTKVPPDTPYAHMVEVESAEGERPGLREFERAAGPSPVHLDLGKGSWLDSGVIYARSPGYAWGRVELGPVTHEDQTLVLERAGELELRFDGNTMGVELALLATDARPARELTTLSVLPPPSRPLLFESLAAGGYVVQARSGGRPIGEVSVEVAAGEREHATLRLGTWSLDHVPLEGVLVLPQAWRCDDPALDLYLGEHIAHVYGVSFHIEREKLTADPGSPDRFRWSASVPIGRYSVLVPCADPFEAEIDTGPAGVHDALIQVPPPALFSLRCVDERTGATVQSERPGVITFRTRDHHWSYHEYAAAEVDGRFPSPWESRMPQGEALFSTSQKLYEPAMRIVTLGPGKNEIVLRLSRKP